MNDPVEVAIAEGRALLEVMPHGDGVTVSAATARRSLQNAFELAQALHIKNCTLRESAGRVIPCIHSLFDETCGNCWKHRAEKAEEKAQKYDALRKIDDSGREVDNLQLAIEEVADACRISRRVDHSHYETLHKIKNRALSADDWHTRYDAIQTAILKAHSTLPANWVYTDSQTTLDLLVAEIITTRHEREAWR